MDLYQAAQERIIITAHRGVSGGNIPCNTIAAYDAAVAQGADMIEIDASLSADGTLFSFHPGMEGAHLGKSCRIPEMHDDEIRQLRYVNYDRASTECGLCTLDEIFERYKNKCFINVDKFWDHPQKISELIRKHNMKDQIVVKTGPSKEMLDIIEQYAPDIAYLALISKNDGTHEELKKRKINYIGAEVLFSSEESELCSEEFIEKMHADRKLVWVNSIIYDYHAQLSARHSDDTAIACDPEYGWGWLADRKFDIIQTDWTLALRLFLEKTGRRYKKYFFKRKPLCF
ncbi:MAG: glycerophosphodiester phosphodiesterase family protein [Clostridia bacterium]|nr:glycerophosphodiester phosphodiesterase family protein [Clostridia bacterium]